MPVETLPSPLRQLARMPVTPPRLRPKGPVGPAFNRQSPLAAGRPKQSAVERLEADKAKYVKSPVALSKQQPVKPAEVRKPLSSHSSRSSALQPTRKTPVQSNTQHTVVPLNLEHLSILISGVSDEPLSSPTTCSEDSQRSGGTMDVSSSPLPGLVGIERREERSCPTLAADLSSPAKVLLKASGPVKAGNPDSAGSPAAVTVRRVDVVPQVQPLRTPCRPQQYMRQPLYSMPAHGLRPAAFNLRHFPHRTTAAPLPVKPVHAPAKPDRPSTPPPAELAVPPLRSSPLLSPSPGALLPPPSPAITRLSSASRKRPSLTRSKSDMSDRYSRAGTELERFFNLCGLDASEVQGLAAPGSDIVSITRFRSASVPGSECAGLGGDEEESDTDDGDAAKRVPYGVSVIERNARVIKWLYGLRQAKDITKSTNM